MEILSEFDYQSQYATSVICRKVSPVPVTTEMWSLVTFVLVELTPYLSFRPSKYKDVLSDTLWHFASAVQSVAREYLNLFLSVTFYKYS